VPRGDGGAGVESLAARKKSEKLGGDKESIGEEEGIRRR
jgi:hypothetical protein